ncbi:MAG TPA: hypothetical protein VHG53_01615 [Candidatus Limnocylindria bacterium]|nr:hypothetical protein [Candidatus Limnocylindria bacterium]
MPAVWDGGYCGTGIRTATIDTGIDASHPDLRDRILAHADLSGAGDRDDVGHGTHATPAPCRAGTCA